MTLFSGPRPLAELAAVLEERGQLVAVRPDPLPEGVGVLRVDYDSRRVGPGSLFVAIPGGRVDGHVFVPDAVASGAVAVIVERVMPGLPVAQIVVRGARPALALAAAWLNGFPSRRLGIVGITGTDGKTTTGFLVRAMLEAAGYPCGLSGTVTTVAGGERYGDPGRATTPEAPELQAALAAMVAAGDRFAVVESTSHGLAQHRVAEIAYDVGLLTNLTEEHLEFHRTHEAYRAAKRRLFEALATGDANPEKGWGKTGIVNADDAWAAEFIGATRAAGAKLLTYGRSGGADIRIAGLSQDGQGVHLAIEAPRWAAPLDLRLAGAFNGHNAAAAVAVGEALCLDPEAIRRGIASVGRVPGRMERIPTTLPFTVVVDYAHTANALRLVLDDLAPVARLGGGGVIAVFGSAGERDLVKRPEMGRAAGERCRLVVLTDEDPRGEPREAILAEIAGGAEESGLTPGRDVLLVPDRREAIRVALRQARPGDVVLLTGKGHESTIEMADGPHPWDERAEAEAALAELERRRG